MIKAENISVKYMMTYDRVKSIKEYLVQLVKGKIHYEEFWALRDISFEVKRGEVLGIIGHNGAGKSTLLKVISGILKPTSGSVQVNGVVVPMLELGSGFDFDLTGRENVFLNGSILGYSEKFLKDKYDEIVEFSELGQFIDVPLRNYSSGMVMRLAFSIATVVQPDILIVDEILAVGDAEFQEKSKKRMLELMGGGTTVLFVSHSLDQVREMCDKVIWLDHGQMKMIGDTQKVCDAYVGFNGAVDNSMGGGEAEPVKNDDEKEVKTNNTITKNTRRNYELDFLKFVFTVMIFLCHSWQFILENTRFKILPEMAGTAVNFFFIVSGMLMVNSVMKTPVTNNCSKSSIDFVLHKFKSMGWVLCSSVVVCMAVNIYIYIKTVSVVSATNIWVMITRIIPEILEVSMAGINLRYNVTWYISAMLIAMLPLSYLLYKKRDFTFYVFAPLMSICIFGYMCQINSYQFIDHDALYGVVTGGIIKAFCGLCFGICSFTIYEKIKQANLNRLRKVLLTIAELAIYLIFFITWFFSWDTAAVMSVNLIMPIAIAITFSGQSYISRIFQAKWMKIFAPISLYVYLNHWGARQIVMTFYSGNSWEYSVLLMGFFTIILCLICYSLVCLSKKIYKSIKMFLD